MAVVAHKDEHLFNKYFSNVSNHWGEGMVKQQYGE